jgi:RHS repeat-associated protein
MTNRRLTQLVSTALLTLVGLLAPKALHAQGPPSAVEYYHLDALGSVRVVTNQSGAVVSRHDLMPFGEEWQPVTLGREALLFTGKERDYDTGLDYFGARYLQTSVARFTTVDPVGMSPNDLIDPQRWNRYAYAKDGPLRFVDPDGRYTTDCSVGDAACNGRAMAFEESRRRLLTDPSTRSAAQSYGDPGKDNGVHVHFNVRRVSTTLRHLAREFTDVSPLSGRPPDAAC